jgi:hypothetical protein
VEDTSTSAMGILRTVLATLLTVVALVHGLNVELKQNAMAGTPSIIVPSGYDIMSRPTKDGAADKVKVGLKLKRIAAANEKDSTVEFDIIIMSSWTDARLKGIVKKTKRILAKDIWVPGLAFSNQATNPTWFEAEMNVDKDGRIMYERHCLISIEHTFNLVDYPFDRHQLPVLINAFGYDSNEVVLEVDYSMRTPALTDSMFNVDAFLVSSKTVKTDISNSQSVVEGDLYVKRKIPMILAEVVLPLMLIVLFTFLSFFVSETNYTDRITITSIGLLTVMTFMFVVNSELPKIAYLTWMHWYMALAFCTTFLVNVHVTMVDFLNHQSLTKSEKNRVHSSLVNDDDKLKKIWTTADKNGNGTLDKDEVKKLFKTYGLKISTDQLDSMFQDMDIDSKGEIDAEGFLSYVKKSGEIELDENYDEAEDLETPLLKKNLFKFRDLVERFGLENGTARSTLMSEHGMGYAFKRVGYTKGNIARLDRGCRWWLPVCFAVATIIMFLIEIGNITWSFQADSAWSKLPTGKRPQNTMMSTDGTVRKVF